MVKIVINNQKSRLIGSIGVRTKLYKDMGIKNPKAFWSPAFRSQKWDGYVRFFGEDSGLFSTGLLPEICKLLTTYGEKYDLEDDREIFKDIHEPEELGGLQFRGYQFDAVRAVLNNRFEGIRFQRGILDEATNAGKSLIAGGIYASFSKKRKGLFLTNSKTLFFQAYNDLVQLFDKETIGRINSDITDWKRINICMVQTLGSRVNKDPKYKNYLAQVDILIMDEADELIGRKDSLKILQLSYNATLRIALTGTALKHKDPIRNKTLITYFGPILHKTTNKQLVDLGVSTKPNIKIYMGNTHIRRDGDYKEEYLKGIIKNKKRHRKIWRLVDRQIGKEKLPLLILFKEHQQAYSLVKEMPEHIRETYSHTIVHHETPNREAIFEKFNNGRIDILISSMIIKRGKNLPLIQTLINAAGGDSQVTVLQIFGRALRSHKTKKTVDVIDLWDVGQYLQRHSKHRVIYYKNQDFPVKELYKQKLKKVNKKVTKKLFNF